jgi:hypothetical protein
MPSPASVTPAKTAMQISNNKTGSNTLISVVLQMIETRLAPLDRAVWCGRRSNARDRRVRSWRPGVQFRT